MRPMAVALVVADKGPKHPSRRELARGRGQPLPSIDVLRESARMKVLDPLRAVKLVPMDERSFPW